MVTHLSIRVSEVEERAVLLISSEPGDGKWFGRRIYRGSMRTAWKIWVDG